VAFFPLNGIYGTREVHDRVPQGIQSGVYPAPGPHGHDNGSYEFSGTSSYIQFNNSAGGVMDVRYSITLLCWIYYDGQDGLIFEYNKPVGGPWGVYMWSLSGGNLYTLFYTREFRSTGNLRASTPLAGGWKFAGVSYDNVSGEAKVWIDRVAEATRNIGAGLELATQDIVRMGNRFADGRYFKGKIAQMQVYNVALTQEQIQEIKGTIVIRLSQK